MTRRPDPRRGAGRAGCFVFIIIIGLFWAGLQNIYTAAVNRSPVEISLADYNKTRPAGHWLKLTDCQADLTDASYLYKGKSVTDVFIPLKVPGGGENDKVHIVFSDTTPGTKALVQQMMDAKTEPQQLAFLKNNGKALEDYKKPRTIQGMIQFGINLQDSDREKIKGADKNLVDDFVIIKAGEEPSWLLGIALTGAGVLVSMLVVWRTRKPA